MLVPNAAQIEYWNDVAGPTWRDEAPRLDALMLPLLEAGLSRLSPAAGERALDVGCGAGASTRALAHAVGPTGQVLGVDISRVLLEEARARSQDLTHAEFVEADVQVADLGEARFDLAFSRFGVMFFEDPVAAFANVLASLRPGGRLGFLCWRDRAENEWITAPMAAVAGLCEPPPFDAVAPGPFAFADTIRVCDILMSAGFDDVGLQALDHVMVLPTAEAIEYYQRVGPFAALLREAPPELRSRMVPALTEHLGAVAKDGEVRLRAGAWWVSATR